MTDDSLTTSKRKDGFEHESPIRAFTEFKVSGTVAIGKGFRPSLAHLSSYLDAMSRKEGWDFVQIILPADDATDPTILFRKVPGVRHIMVDGVPVPVYMPPGGPVDDAAKLGLPVGDIYKVFASQVGQEGERLIGKSPALGEPYTPAETSTPTHYSGRACADIGERLSANAFAILRYCWRVGQKDDPCVEMDKALWYANSEIELLKSLGGVFSPLTSDLTDPNGFLEDRICDESEFTKNIARMLWAPYQHRRMTVIRQAIAEHRFHLDCGRGLAV